MNQRLRESARAAGMKASAAVRLIDEIRMGDGVRQGVEQALIDLVEEVHRWRNAWASEHVDKDRQVREASTAALDCERHGKLIKQLEDQLWKVDEARERIERQRIALLVFAQTVQDSVELYSRTPGIDPVKAMPPFMKSLDAATKKAFTAHKRAGNWTRKADDDAED